MKVARRIGTITAAVIVLVGLLVIPSNAAPQKMFSIQAPASVSATATTLNVTITNETPNGNSNISSAVLNVSGVSGFAVTGGSPGTITTTNGGSTVWINGFSPIKPTKSTTFTLNVTIPNVGCAGGTLTWSAQAFTGNSFGGDEFAFQADKSTVTTTLTTGCTTITATKYLDSDANGSKNGTESTLTSPTFSFSLYAGSAIPPTTSALQTKQTSSGVATFDQVAGGSYVVCEVSTTGWSNTDPGNASACKAITATGATTNVNFGNAQDATITVTKYKDSNLDGSQDTSTGSTETGLSGWAFTVYPGTNTSGTAVAGPTNTDANGNVSFTVSAGKQYTVCETSQAGWFNTDPTDGSGCKTVAASSVTSNASLSLSFGNVQGTLGCVDGENTMNQSGDESSTVDATGIRLPNFGGTECIKVPYDFYVTANGDIVFTKDLTSQPDAQFLITQTLVDDIPTSSTVTPTTTSIGGYTFKISYDGGGTFVAALPCPSVERDGSGNITGATLASGQAYCVADSSVQYGTPSSGKETVVVTWFGRGDPIIRTSK